ncbi:MAG TPA: phenylacetate-CoA oxygenase subunit PaaC [Anaerolineales bacterium]|nr:phenylacetate-CoA oxygenase subunit PaaC [Anaerolineales bacterium]HRQ91301.1 phenylacetate-CoA oxygenase subunit PaaC [Anaerolineales bacterium]
MEQTHQYALSGYLIALADDELILGHRVSEWTGHAPILEEDIAFANLALDEIGHAKLWYELAADLLGEDKYRYPDQLVYFREPAQFRNLQLVELPKGDWAYSTLRQYLFDAFETLRLGALSQSPYTPLAEIAARIRTEELYHLRHSQAWIPRLALGTEGSAHRMQAALDTLWPYAQALAAPLPGEQDLHAAGIVPSSAALFARWRAEVEQFLTGAGLQVNLHFPISDLSRISHSQHFPALIHDLQTVARLDPEATW